MSSFKQYLENKNTEEIIPGFTKEDYIDKYFNEILKKLNNNKSLNNKEKMLRKEIEKELKLILNNPKYKKYLEDIKKWLVSSIINSFQDDLHDRISDLSLSDSVIIKVCSE